MTDLSSKEQEGWLALREASEKMGVSPATLRVWADDGRVESYRTPGGHRRFRVGEASVPFQKEKRGGDARWRLLEHSIVGRLEPARQETELKRMSPQARAQARELERALIHLGTLALQREPGELAERAMEVGAGYGKFNWRHDIAPREALETLAQVRRAFVEGVVEFLFGMGEPDMDELNLWLGRVNEIIDRVSVSMLEYRGEVSDSNVGK